MLSRMSSRPKSFRILFLITTKVNLITADMYTTSVFTYELLMKKYIESNLIHKGKKLKFEIQKFHYGKKDTASF